MNASVSVFFWILIRKDFVCALASAGFSGNEFHALHFLYRENFLIILDLVVIEELVVRGQTEKGLMHSCSCIVGHFIIALLLSLSSSNVSWWLLTFSIQELSYPLDNSWCLWIFFDNHVWNHKSSAHFASRCLLSSSTSYKLHAKSKRFQKDVCLSQSLLVGLFCGNLHSWYKKCVFLLYSFKLGETDHSLSTALFPFTVLLFPVNHRYFCQVF